MTWDPNQPRVPAGDPAGGQWAGGNISRKAFDALSPQQRSDHLKGGGSISDTHVSNLLERIVAPDGGFTYQPFTDQEPKAGFAVSIHPERSFATSVDSLKFNDLVGYIKRNADLLRNHENHLGAWHDPDSHKVFLDVTAITQDRNRAVHLARNHDQIAYYDLAAGKSITVNKHATSGGVI